MFLDDLPEVGLVSEREFYERFRVVQKSAGRWRILDPKTALRAWSVFVDDCERGYEDNSDEYWNDLSIRQTIEEALVDEALRAMPEFAEFQERVRATDQRFRAATMDGVLLGDEDTWWWKRLVPRRAGAELADDFLTMHGVRVEETV